MRKTISILILMVVLCSSLSSCKKQNITPQSKILFTAKKKGIMNLVSLDITKKTKKTLSILPYNPEKIKLSSDQKKLAFHTHTFMNGAEKHDIYSMNVNGSNLTNITKDINFRD